jgi:hypothetical protein
MRTWHSHTYIPIFFLLVSGDIDTSFRITSAERAELSWALRPSRAVPTPRLTDPDDFQSFSQSTWITCENSALILRRVIIFLLGYSTYHHVVVQG